MSAALKIEFITGKDIVAFSRLFPANPGSITPKQFEQWGQEILSSIEKI